MSKAVQNKDCYECALPNLRITLSNRAPSAVFCDRRGVSDQPATMSIFAAFSSSFANYALFACAILQLSIGEVASFLRLYGGNLRQPCATWQQTFLPGAVWFVLKLSLCFSQRFGRSALLQEESGVASRRLFQQ